jgi:carboxypeptidase Taq
MTNFYNLLEQHIAKINKIGSASSVLHWDLTQNTPDGAKENMSEDIGNLSAIAHEMFISKKTEDLIAGSETEILDDWQSVNLRLIKKNYISATALSTEFVEAFSILTSKSQSIWQKAKASSDWDTFSPYLADIVKSVQEMAKIKSDKLGIKPYEALLDEYDQGRTAQEIESVFGALKKELPDLIQQIVEKQKLEKVLPITNHIDHKLQKEISLKIMQKMQFDFSNGRLDEYEHPFCITTSGGVRILSKFLPDDFLHGIMGTIHETGHALYEQNLPKKYKNQPVGKACGMSVHESQSLFMELQVARSRGFSQYLSKLFADDFGFKSPEYAHENLYRLLNHVEPIFIRVNSDEVTYPLHVILRFELEQALLDGSIKVAEIPKIWNEKMQKYLGIVPKNHKNGCMQDVHWSSGGFGYFPCYVGGSINASMLAKTAREKGVMCDSDLAKGDFSNVSGFLRENIWSKGSYLSPSALVENTTGIKNLSSEIFLDYLKGKFWE